MAYGVRFKIENRNGIVEKEKLFDTKEQRDRFAERVEQDAKFIEFTAWLNEDENQNQEGNEMTNNNEETRAQQKTSGVFVMKHVDVAGFNYVGASTQIEVVFRDYLGWCAKDKAPKAIQEAYNELKDATGGEHEELVRGFNWELLEECGKEDFKEKRKHHRALLAGEAPEQEPTPEPEQNEDGELTTEQRNELILERLAAGQSVAEVAENFGISKSMVYKIKNAR